MTKENAIDLIMKLPAAQRQPTLALALMLAEMETEERRAVQDSYTLLEKYGIHKRRVKSAPQVKSKRAAARPSAQPVGPEVQ